MRRRTKRNIIRIIAVAAVLSAVMLAASVIARYYSSLHLQTEAELEDYSVSVIDLNTSLPVNWIVEIPAATMLYDDSRFDEVVIVKRLMVTNTGNQPVQLTATLTDPSGDFHNISETGSQMRDGICLLIADGAAERSSYQNYIKGLLRPQVQSDAVDMSGAVRAYSEETLGSWGGELKPGQENSMYLTILIWQQSQILNELNALEDLDLTVDYDLTQHLALHVAQR